jgi:hypothetical protein
MTRITSLFGVAGIAIVAGMGGYWIGALEDSGIGSVRPGLGPKQQSLYNEIGVFSTDADLRAYMNRRYDFDNGAFPFVRQAAPDYDEQEERDVQAVTKTLGQFSHAQPVAYTYYRRLDELAREGATTDEYIEWLTFVLRTGESAMYLAALDGEEALYDAIQRSHDCVLFELAHDGGTDISNECLPDLRNALSEALGVELMLR